MAFLYSPNWRSTLKENRCLWSFIEYTKYNTWIKYSPKNRVLDCLAEIGVYNQWVSTVKEMNWIIILTFSFAPPPPSNSALIILDCVWTCVLFLPVELEQLLESEGQSLAEMDSVPLDFPWSKTQPSRPPLLSHQGSGSGGYADLIFLHAARELFGNSQPELQYKSLR
jgi:hypothetical protein